MSEEFYHSVQFDYTIMDVWERAITGLLALKHISEKIETEPEKCAQDIRDFVISLGMIIVDCASIKVFPEMNLTGSTQVLGIKFSNHTLVLTDMPERDMIKCISDMTQNALGIMQYHSVLILSKDKIVPYIEGFFNDLWDVISMLALVGFPLLLQHPELVENAKDECGWELRLPEIISFTYHLREDSDPYAIIQRQKEVDTYGRD